MAYVKFQLEDGTAVYIESTDTPKGASGLIPGSKGESADQSAASFESAVESVRKVAAAMLAGLLKDLPEQPSEMQINFGLKASGELGNLVISRGGGEANFSVMLRWRSEDDD